MMKLTEAAYILAQDKRTTQVTDIYCVEFVVWYMAGLLYMKHHKIH